MLAVKKRNEAQVGAGADDDAGRVADQGRCAGDVGGKSRDDQKRRRTDVEPVAYQQGDRCDQQDRGRVVQNGRSESGDQHEQDHDP
jgi:hypothetical protein